METRDIITPCAEGGFVCMPREEFEKLLRKVVKEGAAEGVRQALNQHDVKEISSLLEAWSNTKTTAWLTLVRIITTALLGFIAWTVSSKVNFN